jgi:hypothetical protein
MSPEHWSALRYAIPYFLIGFATCALLERLATWMGVLP